MGRFGDWCGMGSTFVRGCVCRDTLVLNRRNQSLFCRVEKGGRRQKVTRGSNDGSKRRQVIASYPQFLHVRRIRVQEDRY